MTGDLALGHVLLAAAGVELVVALVAGLVLLRGSDGEPARRRLALIIAAAGIATALGLAAVATYTEAAEVRLGGG